MILGFGFVVALRWESFIFIFSVVGTWNGSFSANFANQMSLNFIIRKPEAKL